MPVRFKGLSEYGKNFKWRTSYESSPQMSRWAGLRSDELGITKEPNFSSKRRIPYYNPQVSKSLQWKENEYSAGHDKRKQDFLVEEKIHTPDAPRLQKKSRSQSAVPRMQSKDGQSAAPRMQSSDECPAGPKIQSVDDPLVVPRMQYADGFSAIQKKPSDDGHSVTRMQSANGHSAAQRVHSDDGHPAVPELKNNESDNNTRSAPSTEKETKGFQRVLQRKAGLNIAPSHNPLKMSEYRRQFERKNPSKNSPLLAAEQVIHNKNQSVPPFKINKVCTDTEYKSQFKGSPPVKGPNLRKEWEDKQLMEFDRESHTPKRKDKKKNTYQVDSGSAKVDSTEIGQKEIDQREILKEKVVYHLKNPSKYYRKAKTEYSANFSPPSDYRYKDGAWIRAKQEDPPLSVGSMWVAEVKEQREKAEYYRRRAQGTHFSREHLNQILSSNNSFWDVSSASSSAEDISSNLKALDLAGLQTSSKNEKKHQSPKKRTVVSDADLEKLGSPTMPVRRKLVWEEYDDTEPTKEKLPLKIVEDPAEAFDNEEIDQAEPSTEEEHIETYNATRIQRPHDIKSSPTEDQSECTSISEVEGRLPTPKLKTYGLVQRSHHDLTTPSKGGALLVSPPYPHHTQEHKHEGQSRNKGSPNNSVSNYIIEKKKKKDEELQSLKSPPVAGLKTADPLPLREDPWPSSFISNKPSPATITYPVSRAVENNFVPASQWSSSCRIHGALRDPEFQHNGNFNSPTFYNAELNDNSSIEDDRLSQISARSAASSSLASQVLERAQRRKENFWCKK